MLRAVWKPVAATAVTALVGAQGYSYYKSRSKPNTFELPIKVKGPDGNPVMSNRSFPLLPMNNTEERLSEHASFDAKARPDGMIWKYSTAFLPSNDPIEDAHAHQFVQRDASDPSAPGDLIFFSVMDGHSGKDTSQLLSRVLIKAVALELASLIANPSTVHPPSGAFDKVKSIIWPRSTVGLGLDDDPAHVSLAIQNAFSKLDSELINAPLRVLAANLDEESRKNKVVPDLSQHPLALSTMLPALSGSCALMAVIDTAHQDLYVACTGDCRAVAGMWEESADGQGCWRVEVLSEDQTGRNPNELKRIQSEHPADEASDVVREGRILGRLEPSRAFGDARYKWPAAVQETLSNAFLVGNNTPIRPPPPTLKTPPYVTARPVVTHRKLSIPPLADPSAPASNPTLRFLVLATDGLWDQLTSEDVVSLVGGYLSGVKGVVPKSALSALVPTTTGSRTVEGKDRRRNEGGSWTFVDDNVSTHLIRNAFGGGDEMKLRKLLSIPAPHSRRFRDDVTVTVLWWEEGRDGTDVAAIVPEKNTRAKL